LPGLNDCIAAARMMNCARMIRQGETAVTDETTDRAGRRELPPREEMPNPYWHARAMDPRDAQAAQQQQ
jgi:hypothetical protein